MEKQKPMQCPQCHKISLWHNLKLSPKDNQPYENHKCSCGYLKWETKEVAKKHYDQQFGGVAQTPPQTPLQVPPVPQNSPIASPRNLSGEMLLMEEIGSVNKKVDDNSKMLEDIMIYLRSKLG